MSKQNHYVKEANYQLQRIAHELDEIEQRLTQTKDSIDTWTDEQLTKLRTDWNQAKHQIESMSEKCETEADAAWEQLKSDSENHWQALKSAVQTYRNHVDRNIA